MSIIYLCFCEEGRPDPDTGGLRNVTYTQTPAPWWKRVLGLGVERQRSAPAHVHLP